MPKSLDNVRQSNLANLSQLACNTAGRVSDVTRRERSTIHVNGEKGMKNDNNKRTTRRSATIFTRSLQDQKRCGRAIVPYIADSAIRV